MLRDGVNGGFPGGVRQAALVWNAVLAAESVTTVKMGADTELAVADLVPALRLKERGCARPPLSLPFAAAAA